MGVVVHEHIQTTQNETLRASKHISIFAKKAPAQYWMLHIRTAYIELIVSSVRTAGVLGTGSSIPFRFT